MIIQHKQTKENGPTFHSFFKKTDLQKNVFTTLPEATISDVKINLLHLFVPTISPSSGTRTYFNNSIQKSFTLSFVSWTLDRQVNDTRLKYQFVIGSAHKIISLEYLLVEHQRAARAAAPNKAIILQLLTS